MDNFINSFVEGDQIHVLTTSGDSDKGVFLRFESGFLIWVKSNNGNAIYAISSLEGISIYKL